MFFSRRNQVYPVIHGGCLAVEKHFADLSDWEHECAIQERLRSFSGCARLLSSTPGVTVTQWYPGGTLLDELLRQEREGFDPRVWTALADWITNCRAHGPMLPGDGNLRNFLWSDGQIIGIDLESYEPMSETECAAGIIASLLHYDPPGTRIKQQAAAVLQRKTGVSDALIRSAEQTLLQRRANRMPRAVSGIILAGGRSSRMGCDKSRLLLGGETMLQRQIRKLKAIGISDILISGTAAPEGTRTVPDIYPGRGPLGGLHACLQAAKNQNCLVLSVDVPLVPAAMLDRLCRAHRHGVTVLSHGDCEEPLVGVYSKELSVFIEPLITERGAPVRRLAQLSDWKSCPYLGPEEYLHNCNTPQDYAQIQGILEAFTQKGLDFL